ncbi:molybdenum cofactor biosynthesis protein MoaE [Pelagerythrobacter marensis]|uniref:Molybdopterin synthase catalytic subunit n=1 Tax=Pelagerythrobacter marensis TaxID=543877 RepID=A0A0G3XA01_9SPHN|nr:molybdenum cofactor biosynthesis protein MoaE [Pelagerythrobacter marensis]AKM07439.1 molybdopterin converting factor [Pelagerythrobacter marensis]
MRDLRLLTAPFDPAEPSQRLAAECPEAGGICAFVGRVRAEDGVEALELQQYEPLTLPGIHTLSDRAFDRFDLMGLAILHRVGRLAPGEPVVCVAAAARHRRPAIEAVDYCMDHLKSAAWFWKREKRADGWHWIDPRAEDRRDLARWQQLK